MAENRIIVTLDASAFVKQIKKMEGELFIAIAEHYNVFNELDSELNINRIDTDNGEESV